MSQLPEDRVVLLTPVGRGAVASLRVEGPRAAELVEQYFVGPKTPLTVGRTHVGLWGLPSSGAAASEEVVVCRCESERIEVHCHGGVAASKRIISDLEQQGCSAVSWQDWIGFQEPDGIRTKARVMLAEARTERTALILLDQYNGALSRAIDGVIATLESGDFANATVRIDGLLRNASLGLHLVEPWRVVLAGPPNVGKSSLTNALVGYSRSIVHNQPGTTRDAVSVSAAFDGWPVELTDTAGLRISADGLEAAGIERARQQAAAADAVLLVFDAAQPWTIELAKMVDELPAAITVHNKQDLLHSNAANDSRIALADRPPGVATSALEGTGIKALIVRVVSQLVCDEPPPGAAVPFSADQIARLREARDYLKQGELHLTVASLRMLHAGLTHN